MTHFISSKSALQIHEDLIKEYGGAHGIRDYGLLLSSLEIPKASFAGQDLHSTLFEKAAAYLYTQVNSRVGQKHD